MTGAPVAALVAATSSDEHLPGGFVGSLLHFHGPAAYAVVAALVFGEAALLLGFFIPGETAAVVGGVLAGLGRVDLGLMIAVVVVSAIVGDSVGYEVGKRAGPWFLRHRPMRGNLAVVKTMALLERHGGPAVFLGRFLAFARAMIPGLAGFSGLRYRTFLLYNAAGGLVWGVGYTLLGYVVGVSFERVLKQVGIWSAVGVAAVVVAAVALRLVFRRRRDRREAAAGEAGDAGIGATEGDGGPDADEEEGTPVATTDGAGTGPAAEDADEDADEDTGGDDTDGDDTDGDDADGDDTDDEVHPPDRDRPEHVRDDAGGAAPGRRR